MNRRSKKQRIVSGLIILVLIVTMVITMLAPLLMN